MYHFQASQSLRMTVPDEAVSIQHYLRQPQRLVQAITDSTRIEPVGKDLYRLSLRSRKFLSFNIEPTATLRVWSSANDVLHLKAVDCQVLGFEHLNRSFELGLEGILVPTSRGAETEIHGEAHLQVQLELPPPMQWTPKPLVESTGRAFLSGILATMKHRLERQLVSDYRAWVADTAGPTRKATGSVERSPVR